MGNRVKSHESREISEVQQVSSLICLAEGVLMRVRGASAASINAECRFLPSSHVLLRCHPCVTGTHAAPMLVSFVGVQSRDKWLCRARLILGNAVTDTSHGAPGPSRGHPSSSS